MSKCEHLNADGTFKGGFDGCVLHMMAECGGNHSQESAKKICGSIAQRVGASNREQANDRPVLRAQLATDLNGDGRMMYVPAGVHEIQCGLGEGGQAAAVLTIKVDEATAAVLQASLAEVNARNAPQRACFDFEHQAKEAMAWPKAFEWGPGGVYARAEYSSLGRDYVKGKVVRAFSGSFYTDADLPKRKDVKAGKVYEPAEGKRGSPQNPARITAIAFPYAGTLTNNPAFRANLPLWASGRGQERTSPTTNKERTTMTTEEKATLQARIAMLEQEINVLRAKEESAENTQAIEARESEVDAAKAKIEAAELQARNTQLEQAVLDQRKRDAKAAVQAAVKRGALAPKDMELQATWERLCTEDPEHIALLANMHGAPALRQRLTLGQVEIKREDSQAVLNAFATERNPVKRAAIYATEIRKRLNEGDPLPLQAGNNVGTLVGTLVTQRTLELLKFTFPVLSSISTDFSDQQAHLGQTIDAHITTIPAVQDYDANNGWPDSDAISTDVPLTLNKQKGVPITFTADTLSGTVRRLFDEFGPAQAYALAKSMVDALYALFLAANYTNAATVAALIDFGRGTLIDTGTALDDRGVPDGPTNRFALLNSKYYGQLKKDPAIVSLSAFQDKAIIEQGVLPDVEGFRVIKAPNMPGTANLVGFAGSKSAAVIAARVDSDYTTILPGAAHGNVTTVTDPDIGLTVLQVQYVDHKKASATQRISFIFGVAVGQNNAGNLIKSAG